MAKKKKEFGSLMEMMEFFKQTGSEGGKVAAENMTAKARKERAKKAAAASAAVRSARAAAKKKAAGKPKKGSK